MLKGRTGKPTYIAIMRYSDRRSRLTTAMAAKSLNTKMMADCKAALTSGMLALKVQQQQHSDYDNELIRKYISNSALKLGLDLGQW